MPYISTPGQAGYPIRTSFLSPYGLSGVLIHVNRSLPELRYEDCLAAQHEGVPARPLESDQGTVASRTRDLTRFASCGSTIRRGSVP